jgi:hypothetical protein
MFIKALRAVITSDLLSSRAKGAADGAPDNRRLGSARCWSDPDSATKDRNQRRVQNLRQMVPQAPTSFSKTTGMRLHGSRCDHQNPENRADHTTTATQTIPVIALS